MSFVKSIDVADEANRSLEFEEEASVEDFLKGGGSEHNVKSFQ